MTIFDVVEPLAAPGEFPSLRNARGWRTLQRGLRVRVKDRCGFLVRAWAPPEVSKVPYYLTPSESLWNNGIDGQKWLHQSFSVFETEEAAVAGADHLRARDWTLLELIRVDVMDGRVCLLPVPRTDVQS